MHKLIGSTSLNVIATTSLFLIILDVSYAQNTNKYEKNSDSLDSRSALDAILNPGIDYNVNLDDGDVGKVIGRVLDGLFSYENPEQFLEHWEKTAKNLASDSTCVSPQNCTKTEVLPGVDCTGTSLQGPIATDRIWTCKFRADGKSAATFQSKNGKLHSDADFFHPKEIRYSSTLKYENGVLVDGQQIFLYDTFSKFVRLFEVASKTSFSDRTHYYVGWPGHKEGVYERIVEVKNGKVARDIAYAEDAKVLAEVFYDEDGNPTKKEAYNIFGGVSYSVNFSNETYTVRLGNTVIQQKIAGDEDSTFKYIVSFYNDKGEEVGVEVVYKTNPDTTIFYFPNTSEGFLTIIETDEYKQFTFQYGRKEINDTKFHAKRIVAEFKSDRPPVWTFIDSEHAEINFIPAEFENGKKMIANKNYVLEKEISPHIIADDGRFFERTPMDPFVRAHISQENAERAESAEKKLLAENKADTVAKQCIRLGFMEHCK